jgi:hypothetical protein
VDCGGDYVEVGHRFGGGFELIANGLLGATPLEHVAVDASVEADLVGSVDINTELIERE